MPARARAALAVLSACARLAPAACSGGSLGAGAALSEDGPTLKLRGGRLKEQSTAQSSTEGTCSDCYMGHRLDVKEFPNAVCLDGSPGFFNIRRASSAASQKKWFLFYQGGGWCSPELPESFAGPDDAAFDSCYHRSTTDLGSSTSYQERISSSDAASWFSDTLSAEKSKNPLLYDWNSVLFRYCDGGSYSGKNLTSVAQEGRRLHFKGGFIREAFLRTLLEYGLGDATEVIISGCSAGGLATYLHVDWWRDALPSAFVAALPDSGYFLDWSSSTAPGMPGTYGSLLRQIFRDINATHSVNAACVSGKVSKGEDTSDCFFAQHTVPYISSPIWVSQSIHDRWQITFEPGRTNASNTEDVDMVNAYGDTMVEALTANGFNASKPGIGGFIDSCEHHCFGFTSTQIDGVRRIDAFNEWYAMQLAAHPGQPAGPTLWQLRPWVCTGCCDNV